MYKKKYAMFSLEGDMLVDGIVNTALKNRFDFKWVEQKLEKLAELEAKTGPVTKNPNKPKNVNAGEIGAIAAHDPQNDFFVINVGSNNGVNKGDKFTIFRGGIALGKIEIARTQPTVSIAIYQRGFPKPTTPFESGDKVMKFK